MAAGVVRKLVMSIVASQTPELSGGHEGNNVAGCALSPPGVATTLGTTLSGWSPPSKCRTRSTALAIVEPGGIELAKPCSVIDGEEDAETLPVATFPSKVSASFGVLKLLKAAMAGDAVVAWPT